MPDLPVEQSELATVVESARSVLLRESAAADQPAGSAWEVLILAEGLSLNGNRYGADLLSRSARLFESAGVFAYELAANLHDHLPDEMKAGLGQGGGLLRNRIGQLADVRHEPGRGLVGTLRVAATWAREALRDLWAAGQQAAVGFSIDALASATTLADGTRQIEAFGPHPTLDLVSHPAAGGRLERLVASLSAAPVRRNPMPESTPQAAQTPAVTPAPVAPAVDPAEIERRVVEAAELRMAIREAVTSTIQASGLPTPAQARVTEAMRARVAGLTSPEQAKTETERAVESERVYLQQIAPAAPAPQGTSRTVEAGQDQLDRYQAAMDGMIAGRAVGKVPPFRSIRESVAIVTGKHLGYDVSPMDVLRLVVGYQPADPHAITSWERRSESKPGLGSPFRRVQESVTVATWGQLLGDSITRQMVAEYSRDDRQTWRKICSSIVSVSDFRTMRRMLMGGYGTLPAVAEGGNYQPLASPADTEETYAVSKRGGTEDLTLEAIINDDVGAVRRIPVKLGQAAAETLQRFVFGILTTNGLMADGTALFAAAVGRVNLLTAALSGRALRDVRLSMMDKTQYGDASAVMGAANAPKILCVPNELEETAYYLTRSPMSIAEPDATGAMKSDQSIPNPEWNRAMEVVVVPFWTNAKDWYTIADPTKVPTIEVGFLNGNDTPELFIQDQANVGANFTADKTTWKIRHIYGGAPLDFRGMHFNDVP